MFCGSSHGAVGWSAVCDCFFFLIILTNIFSRRVFNVIIILLIISLTETFGKTLMKLHLGRMELWGGHKIQDAMHIMQLHSTVALILNLHD